MRKLLVTGVVSVSVFMSLPAAASANVFSGSCHVTGVATFSPPIGGQTAAGHFDFRSGPPDSSTPDGTTCSGTVNGKSESGPVVVHVAGDGQLGCNTSSGQNAPGSITFSDGTVAKFLMDFSGLATEVSLTLHGASSGSGSGHASFAKRAPPTTPLDCAQNNVKQLGFDADATADSINDGVTGSAASTGGTVSGASSGGSTPGKRTTKKPSCKRGYALKTVTMRKHGRTVKVKRCVKIKKGRGKRH